MSDLDDMIQRLRNRVGPLEQLAADELERMDRKFKDHMEGWRANNQHFSTKVNDLEKRVKQLEGLLEAEKAIASALVHRLAAAGIELESRLEHLIVGRDPS
jgi:primosomal protein N''